MGFSFRKSFKIAPGIRINASTKGLGISAGVKGARISAGPRGVHAYGGIGSIRYQKQLIGSKQKSVKGITSGQSINSSTNPLLVKKPKGNFIGKYFIALFFFVFSFTYLIHYLNHGNSLEGFFTTVIISFGVFYWARRNHKRYKVMRPGFEKFIEARNQILKGHLTKSILEEIEEKLLFTIKRYPHDGVKFYLASINFQQKKFKESSKLLEELVLESRIEMLKSFYCQSLVSEGQFQKALDNLPEENFLDADDLIDLWEIEARAYMGLRQYDLAMDSVKKGLSKRKPEFTLGKRKLKVLEAEIYLAMGETKKAKARLSKVLKEHPDNKNANDLLFKIDKKAG